MPSLSALISQLDERSHARGREFERICRWYLQNDRLYQSVLSKVWLWNDWPGRWGSDAGIDLVGEDHDGALWAIQAKVYSDDHWITKADVDTFLSESGRPGFTRRLIFATTNHIGPTALRTLRGQKVPATFVALAELERAQVDWPRSPRDLRARRLPPKPPRAYQTEAVVAICAGFTEHDRGTVVMACGSGKTLVGLWVAEQMGSLRTLLLFPSLSLLAQTLREWTANASRPFAYLAVCSDATVSEPDSLVEYANDLGVGVTTDSSTIRAFLGQEGTRIVFATYQSSPKVALAMRDWSVPAFDLTIADEAHRCAGPVAADFARVLDPRAIRSKRRLFMTATPRYFTGRMKREASESDFEIASMDDEDHFGPVLHRLPFSEAIRRGLLSDYRVAIVGIDDTTYRSYAQRGVFVTTDGKSVTDARTLAAQIGVARAMARFDLRRTVTFHSRVASARRFSRSISDVVAWMPEPSRPSGTLWCDYVSGAMPSGERDVLLGRFRDLGPSERGLLSNARCLAEGVDVPSIDGIAFVDPRRSQIDIVQAVGRAIRKSPDKIEGTVVLPVFINSGEPAEAALESSAFKPVWDVLRALRAHDDKLGYELDGLRRQLGRYGTALTLPGKIVLDLPTAIGPDFVRALTLHVVESTTETWEFLFGLLQGFVAEHGHARPPSKWTTVDGHRLGGWVTKQRSRRNQMRAEQAAALADLPGWSWQSFESAWDRGFQRLDEFVQVAGRADVPSGHVEGGYPLSRWVNNQRSAHMAGRLSDERRSRLEALPGWVWNERDEAWENGLRALRRFSTSFGHVRVAKDYVDPAGYKLGQWAQNARSFHKRGALEPERVKNLDAIPSWRWDWNVAKWDEGCSRLRAYVQRHGDARVPSSFVDEDGYRLGIWVVTQRHLYNDKRLSEDRIKQMEAIKGWRWDAIGRRIPSSNRPRLG